MHQSDAEPKCSTFPLLMAKQPMDCLKIGKSALKKQSKLSNGTNSVQLTESNRIAIAGGTQTEKRLKNGRARSLQKESVEDM